MDATGGEYGNSHLEIAEWLAADSADTRTDPHPVGGEPALARGDLFAAAPYCRL